MPTFRSFAKLNLHLEVLDRRPDGFHELRTLFQTVDFGEELEVEPTARGKVELEVEGADLPADERNLAFQAAAAYLQDWGGAGEGVRLRLRKRLPVGAGLGGGSANAGTVLRVLPALFARDPDPGWTATAARRLGADVPFFLVGGLALGLGRGDEIVPLGDLAAADDELWLALSGAPLSTADVFAALGDRPAAEGRESPIDRLRNGAAVPALESLIGVNDLERPAFALRPALGALYTALVRSGARRVRMSGSGSTLFALYSGPAAARRAADSLPPDIEWRRVRTLGRDAWCRACGFDSIEGGG